MRFIAVVFTVLLLGCVSYNPATIEQLSQKNQYVTAITPELCADFFKGASALTEGPAKAYPWFGRAREIEAMNVALRKQGIACYAAESRDLAEGLVARVLQAFKETWRAAEEIVQ